MSSQLHRRVIGLGSAEECSRPGEQINEQQGFPRFDSNDFAERRSDSEIARRSPTQSHGQGGGIANGSINISLSDRLENQEFKQDFHARIGEKKLNKNISPEDNLKHNSN